MTFTEPCRRLKCDLQNPASYSVKCIVQKKWGDGGKRQTQAMKEGGADGRGGSR